MTNFILHVPFLRHDPAALRDAWTFVAGYVVFTTMFLALLAAAAVRYVDRRKV